MTNDQREYDVVLWGATSFAGTYVAEFLAERYPDELRWAIAGRNEEKLSELRAAIGDRFGVEVPILLGDSFDRESLERIAERTRVVCTTVGPYSKYGSELVGACVANGTHYCDLTGEPHWIQQMIDRHHAQARERGARIVHACGFDSIPSDLGALLVQDEATRRFGSPCPDVALFVRRMRGDISGGTAASMKVTIEEAAGNREVRRVLANPYALRPKGEREGPRVEDQMGPRYEEDLDAWSAPFVMATVNTRVVHRSNALFGYPWGREFAYREAMSMGRGVKGMAQATAFAGGLGAFVAGMSLGPTRKLLEKYVLPAPGEGPSRERVESGMFDILLVGHHPDGEVRVTVRAERDPGYGATANMLGESAVCLALDDLETPAGVLTPATAMGTRLVERLNQAGVVFDCVA